VLLVGIALGARVQAGVAGAVVIVLLSALFGVAYAGFGILVAVTLGALVGVLIVSGDFNRAIREFTLPLRHEDIIRQQAADKGVDASLIAAVIYSESPLPRPDLPRGRPRADADNARHRVRESSNRAGERHAASTTSPIPRSTSPTGPFTWATCSTGTTATPLRRWRSRRDLV